MKRTSKTRSKPIRPSSDRTRGKARNLATRADLARERGVSRGAVTHAAEPGGPLFDAVVGSKVDLDHPATIAWLAGGSTALPEMRELILRKRAAEVERLESRNERDANLLISRGLVQQHVLGMLAQLHLRLLGSASTTLAARIGGAVRAGATNEELKELASTIIGAELRETKRRVTGALGDGTCTAGDKPREVREAVATPQSNAATTKPVVAAIRARLRAAAPQIVKLVFQEVARAGAGGKFDPAVFERAMAAHGEVEHHAALDVSVILAGHIDAAVSAISSEVPES